MTQDNKIAQGSRFTPHWTEQMFLKHANLFLKIHEAFLKSAPEQAKEISDILSQHGIKNNARILDLGCGIGRHSVHLARLGYHVVGVDLSPVFLKRAEELASKLRVAQRATFLQCDYRSLTKCLHGSAVPFDAIINLWSSIGYYTDEDDIRTLKQCRTIAKRGAILMIETINSEFLAKHFLPVSYSEFEDLMLLEERKMNYETARVDTEWRFYQKKGRDLLHKGTINFGTRVYTAHELHSILKQTGWRHLETSGGLSREPLTPDARRILVVAQAA